MWTRSLAVHVPTTEHRYDRPGVRGSANSQRTGFDTFEIDGQNDLEGTVSDQKSRGRIITPGQALSSRRAHPLSYQAEDGDGGHEED